MPTNNTLQGWAPGAPPVRDDGALAIVELAPGVQVGGQDHYGHPIIVSRRGSKLKTTGSAHRLSYDDVVLHIDITSPRRPDGWALLTAKGETADFRPRVRQFFGATLGNDEPKFDADAIARQDRENPGDAPHRCVEVFFAGQPASQAAAG